VARRVVKRPAPLLTLPAAMLLGGGLYLAVRLFLAGVPA
jgi:hypothetical protein